MSEKYFLTASHAITCAHTEMWANATTGDGGFDSSVVVVTAF
jgi:hypothetical protein